MVQLTRDELRPDLLREDLERFTDRSARAQRPHFLQFIISEAEADAVALELEVLLSSEGGPVEDTDAGIHVEESAVRFRVDVRSLDHDASPGPGDALAEHIDLVSVDIDGFPFLARLGEEDHVRAAGRRGPLGDAGYGAEEGDVRAAKGGSGREPCEEDILPGDHAVVDLIEVESIGIHRSDRVAVADGAEHLDAPIHVVPYRAVGGHRRRAARPAHPPPNVRDVRVGLSAHPEADALGLACRLHDQRAALGCRLRTGGARAEMVGEDQKSEEPGRVHGTSLRRGDTADGRVTCTVSRPGSETKPCPRIVLEPR